MDSRRFQSLLEKENIFNFHAYCHHWQRKHLSMFLLLQSMLFSHLYTPQVQQDAENYTLEIHLGNLTAGTQSHGGLVQMIFLFKQVDFQVPYLPKMAVSKNRGVYPKSAHFNRVFHNKPSILGGLPPLFLVQHPNGCFQLINFRAIHTSSPLPPIRAAGKWHGKWLKTGDASEIRPKFTKHFRYLKWRYWVLSLIRLFWGWIFPYISLRYCLYRWVPPF